MLLSRKLPLTAVILTITTILITSMAGIIIGSKGLEKSSYQTLSAIADGRRNQIELYLENTRIDISTFASSSLPAEAVTGFTDVWEYIKGDPKEELQKRYITDNPNPVGEKHLLETAQKDGYDGTHRAFHKYFLSKQQANGYYDVFLINMNADVVYSVFKEADFATNLSTGEWKDTALASLFKQITESDDPKKIIFKDFAPYGPSNNAPTSFIGKAIMQGDEKVGVLVYQMPAAKIANIIENRTGLSDNGETILLNKDGYLLMDSPFTPNNDVLTTQLKTDLIKNSSTEHIATGEISGYRDMESAIAIVHLDFLGTDWLIASVESMDDAMAAVASMRNAIAIVALVLFVLTLIASIWFAKSVTKPIDRIVDMMTRLTGGDTDIDLSKDTGTNEIGKMADAVMTFRDAAIEKVTLETEATKASELSEAERLERDVEKEKEANDIRRVVDTLGQSMDRLAAGDLSVQINDEFGQGLDGLRTTFNSAVSELSQTMTQVTESITTIDSNAGEMRHATETLSTRTEEQARSLQIASASIEEITATVQQSASDAKSASDKADATRKNTKASREIVSKAINSMSRIEEASNQISSIIGVIDEISFQTNLLALNAGVEAARAGESGRGFAVVAQEVRELAQRSSEAAQDIKELIETSSKEVAEGVNNVTETGSALNSISEDVNEISEFIQSIATATSEQSVGLGECNRTVNDLDGSTQQNAAMAEETTAVTVQLAQNAEDLAALVVRFKTQESEQTEIRKVA